MIPAPAAAARNTNAATAPPFPELIRFALPVLSGVLYALIFPKFDLWWLAFLWPLPLYGLLKRVSGAKSAFFSGWLCGFTAFLILLYWVPVTIQMGEHARGQWLTSVLGWTGLAGYLALFFGLYALAASKFLTKPLVLACAWVIGEWLRAWLLGGFPWALLGYGLTHSLPLLQWAEWGGIYFLGFLPILVSALIYLAWKKKAWFPAFAGMTLIIFCWGAGFWRMRQLEPRIKQGPSIAILQANVYQYEKWDESRARGITANYMDLARRAEEENPDLIFWPETSWPYLLNPGQQGQDSLFSALSGSTIPHLAGVLIEENGRIYNSALLIKNGEVIDRYDKTHLVPFGEFVPFSGILRRWFNALSAIGETEPGGSLRPLQWDQGQIGASICYESIFSEIASSLAASGARWLMNLTNDGWYLDTAAPYQHFRMNIPRAVENRISLARAANTGISGVIDPLGRVVSKTGLNERTVLVSKLTALEGYSGAAAALMRKLFPVLCVLIYLFAIMTRILRQGSLGESKGGTI